MRAEREALNFSLPREIGQKCGLKDENTLLAPRGTSTGRSTVREYVYVWIGYSEKEKGKTSSNSLAININASSKLAAGDHLNAVEDDEEDKENTQNRRRGGEAANAWVWLRAV